jgi:ribonuclease P protein subunit RPR2
VLASLSRDRCRSLRRFFVLIANIPLPAMSKKTATPKPPKARQGPKHIQARLSYLHRAAQYLAEQQAQNQGKDAAQDSTTSTASKPDTLGNQTSNRPSPSLGNPHRLVSDLRSISRKTNARVPPEVKHSFCKVCDAALVDGWTSVKRVENASRDQKKPWADVLMIQCQTCGTLKRFPVGAKRQPKKAERDATDLGSRSQTHAPSARPELEAAETG